MFKLVKGLPLKNSLRVSIRSLTQLRQTHTLPKLDYPVEGGIAPAISARQLDFHYNKHHKTYVDKLNTLIQGTKFEKTPLDKIIVETGVDKSQVAIFNNAAQHFNHSFFWKCLKPNGSKMPKKIEEAIINSFGSVDKFKLEFTQRAVNLFGSGWVWLVLDGASLKIWSGSNAACPLTEGLIPILTIDVWEHSYYLDFQNRRVDFIDKFWQTVNWEFCNNVLEESLKVVEKKM